MQQQQPSGWAIGWTYFAAFMMMMIGVWHAIAGLAALVNDEFLVLTQEYVFKFDATTWGWIHLILGIVVVFAGFGLFSGALWARTIGVILAVVSGIAAFAWLPYQPFWGLLMIFASISVIWALTAHGRDVVE
ncbi:MAG TPA: hypothetical protein VFK59_04705 [Actinomycetota bacterium]|nr:hypothetical protein [Actinomycetota bacterium]